MTYLMLTLALGLAVYNAWLLRQIRRAGPPAGAQRLGAIAEELIATAEEVATAVAERSERLQELILRADGAAARLQPAASDARLRAASPAAQVRPSMDPPPARTAHSPHREGAPDRAAPANARVLQWQPAELQSPSGSDEAGPAHAAIYNLADSGVDIPGIARQLGMARGEVELILGLRRLN